MVEGNLKYGLWSVILVTNTMKYQIVIIVLSVDHLSEFVRALSWNLTKLDLPICWPEWQMTETDFSYRSNLIYGSNFTYGYIYSFSLTFFYNFLKLF